MWIYNNNIVTDIISEEFDSFVYLIERLNYDIDSKSPVYYVGKKSFYKRVKKKKKTIIYESNWQEYYGSSDWLNSDIEKYGKHNFKRTILHFCKTKGDSGYMECKEQMDRNVLHVDKNGYKLYYNKNIMGNYRNDPTYYELNEHITDYFNSLHNHGNNYSKRWITNGKDNRLVTKKIATQLVNGEEWSFGRCERHVHVNDGISNLQVPASEAHLYNVGVITKWVNNGALHKRVPLEEADELVAKFNYVYGCLNGRDTKWINDGQIEKKVSVDEPVVYPWILGRILIRRRNISVYKDGIYRFIENYRLADYEKDGWVKQGRPLNFDKCYATNDIEQKLFKSKVERNEFLEQNDDWRPGQLVRENFNTTDKVFAVNIHTDEKITMSREEFRKNRDYVGINSSKVKIKSKNRIVFTGYIEKFIMDVEPNVPKYIFMNALRSNKKIYFHQGKYTQLNEKNYTLTIL